MLSTITSCVLLECLLMIGCVSIPLGNPFWTELGTIEAGNTTRDEVHGLLGEPWYVIDDWDVDVYFRKEGAMDLMVFIPVPRTSIHYLLVVYRKSGVVDFVDSFRDWGPDWVHQERVHGYTFNQSNKVISLVREGGQLIEQQQSWEEQRSMYPCLFTSGLKTRKEYVELPDVKLYPTPESTKPVEQRRIQQRIERDNFTKKIFAFTESRAHKGDPEAQLELFYVRHDPLEKLKWLCRAADQGQRNAQKELADLYREGCGVINQDLARAYVWFSLALQGDVGEYRSNLDSVIKFMSQAQLNEAEHMLTNWKPGQCERDLVPIDSDN